MDIVRLDLKRKRWRRTATLSILKVAAEGELQQLLAAAESVYSNARYTHSTNATA